MTPRELQLSQWFYRGLWGVLTNWFRVPALPPQLPALDGEVIQILQPAPGFLRYLKFQFWILLTVIDAALVLLWGILTLAVPWLGLLITPLAVTLIIVPDVIAYLAIHLRFDTTWYLISDRSMRIRRGIWIIHETTITFENVQNVTVNQGPLQRYFGIADVIVDTAGGGGRLPGKEGAGLSGMHQGLIEGIDNAPAIRELIMNRLKASRSAGLGDEPPTLLGLARPAWSPDHLAVLRDIHAVALQLAAQGTL